MIDAAASLAAQVSIIRFTLTLPNSDLHPETAFSDVGKIRNGKSAWDLSPRATEVSVAIQDEDAEFRIGHEFRDSDRFAAQYPLSVPGRVRPSPEPHDLRRRTYGCGEFVKVGVRAHNDEAPGFGKLPDLTIRAFQQPDLDNVSRLRE